MNFIRGNIIGRKINKKGFTLIELMIVSALIGVITSAQIIIISKYMKMHRTEIIESREAFYVNEAFIIIEAQISSAKYVKIDNNQIVLKRYYGVEHDYIREDKDSDIIISYGAVYSSTTNNILKRVKDFKVEGKGDLAYITIETKRGKVYKRCLALERKRVRGDLY
ncbi:prepilin-type N-terminal cleavage/methylation domain-containing protein [Clostridiaceae bacterium UIB06]|uniref:Prepilin-type N-terminal cleavage/methylation domain-containing protein n=1 Tax=Clostridium thailandense TaxID=2794346 RepID=A0A949WSG1_9CLOT|nr:prepilin-type N-terminal cleavage/methylation domain-containing protein [Clostridium thailandense]MBV7275046.1 prepilin-type N-terminal cleavage/methylation domain-containing protein [Clostridium thailandense]MCH5136560.1 prepilin-type N-terminal cleavage/methylation domain-containing protein [Clostridiaceae bacterium UIB06]